MSGSEADNTRASAGASPLLRLRCDGCGYGVSVRGTPERCPMCGGSAWNAEGWRPFADLARDLDPVSSFAADAPLSRESASGVFPGQHVSVAWLPPAPID